MASDGELEAAQLTRIDSDLAEITTHVNSWINDRFLTPDSPAALNLEDVSGLILWLQQWRIHFDEYADSAAALANTGKPALHERLTQVRAEIDNSIASFTEMSAGLLRDQES